MLPDRHKGVEMNKIIKMDILGRTISNSKTLARLHISIEAEVFYHIAKFPCFESKIQQVFHYDMLYMLY